MYVVRPGTDHAGAARSPRAGASVARIAGGQGTASMELIRLEQITKTYRLGEIEVPVLKGVSLSIARGEMVALMGASGSGKTTLMNILGCLDRPSSGQYWLDGQEMSRLMPNQRALARTAKLGFVFQSFNLLPRTTAVQNVIMPLDYAPHRPRGDDSRRLARTLLERVGLGQRCQHPPVANVGRATTARGHCSGTGQPPRAASWPTSRRATSTRGPRRDPQNVPDAQCRGHHRDPRHARCEGGGLRGSNDPHHRWVARRRWGGRFPAGPSEHSAVELHPYPAASPPATNGRSNGHPVPQRKRSEVNGQRSDVEPGTWDMRPPTSDLRPLTSDRAGFHTATVANMATIVAGATGQACRGTHGPRPYSATPCQVPGTPGRRRKRSRGVRAPGGYPVLWVAGQRQAASRSLPRCERRSGPSAATSCGRP